MVLFACVCVLLSLRGEAILSGESVDSGEGKCQINNKGNGGSSRNETAARPGDACRVSRVGMPFQETVCHSTSSSLAPVYFSATQPLMKFIKKSGASIFYGKSVGDRRQRKQEIRLEGNQEVGKKRGSVMRRN